MFDPAGYQGWDPEGGRPEKKIEQSKPAKPTKDVRPIRHFIVSECLDELPRNNLSIIRGEIPAIARVLKVEPGQLSRNLWFQAKAPGEHLLRISKNVENDMRRCSLANILCCHIVPLVCFKVIEIFEERDLTSQM